MGNRYIGYLSDRGLSLYEAGNSKWVLIEEFEGAGSTGKLADCLQRDKPIHFLADLVEMEFRFHQVPCLRGADRRALQERKLAQAFRTTPYRHALSLGRSPGRNGEESLLLSAITNPALVEPWLAPLRERRLPLSGIASSPALLGLLAGSLTMDNPHQLLATLQSHGGIRLSYFVKGNLLFSRLANHPGQSGHPEEALFEEVARTHQYLLGLRLIESDSPLEVACLLPDCLAGAWRSPRSPADGFKFRCIGLQEVARLAGIKSARASESTEHLLIALLLKSGFPNHFAPAPERRSHRLLQVRKSLLAASGGIAAAATVATAILFHDIREKGQQTRLAEAAAVAIEREVDLVRRGFPDSDAPAGEIREALALAGSLHRENAPNRLLLADISRGLDATPSAELDRLSWGRSDRPDNISDAGLLSETASSPPSPDESGPRRWVAMVSGEIVGIGDYREANAAVDALGRAIRQGNLDVQVLRYPFNIRPDRELQEDLGKPAAARQPFLLRILWRE